VLLDAAERLFAEHGVDAVSVRAVNAAAGFGPAAVNYHFGTKRELLAAIVNRRFAPVVAGQVARLEAIEHGPRPTTEQLVEVLAVGFFDLLAREPVAGARWLRVVTELVHANDPLVTRRRGAARLEERLMVQLERRHPTRDAAFLEPRWRLAILSLMAMLGASGDEFTPEMLVQFTARGFDGVCGA
jgi:AcrR family transcriptional regulator